MDPGCSQLAVLWEREKTQSIAFVSSVVAPKRCTGHHLELLFHPRGCLFWFANHGFAMQISYRYQSTDLEMDDWRM
jgi:hypothetical protein